ncbi:MAG: ABC transporter ATP-binding protein [Microthrixaceae bacterium]
MAAEGLHADISVDLSDPRRDAPAFELRVVLEVAPGEVLAVVGPNGAGKSTCLRAIAGLQPIGAGMIGVGDRIFDAPAASVFVEPDRRSVGTVFQDYLLFPHLDAIDNVAFGLRAAGRSKADARAIARGWLERMDLTDRMTTRAPKLSGGETQRVALARALATEPDVLLLDEPLAALDVTTRTSVLRTLRSHLEEFAGPTVMVSHDPLDAFMLADSIAVVEDGRVTQTGSITEVTRRPRTRYIADLVGVNLLTGTGRGHEIELSLDAGETTTISASVRAPARRSMHSEPGWDEGVTPAEVRTVRVADAVEGPAVVLISPRAVSVHRDRPDTSARNVWPMTISGMDALGEVVRVRLQGEVDLVAEVTPAAVSDLRLHDEATVWVSVKATEVTAYPA